MTSENFDDRISEIPGEPSVSEVTDSIEELDKIQTELDRLRNPTRSYLRNIVILAVSLFLFSTLGLLRFTWQELGIIVTVLLVHESGHFIGMKIFKYRNVQMFFIPLFGAAVSGYETNPSGSKKAIVSLLGPVPGLILALVCAAIYTNTNQQIYWDFAIFLAFINGFNLLPLHPLDGGRFFEYILFSRRPWAEIIFKTLTAIALMGLAYFLQSWLLLGIFLGFILVTVRGTWISAKIAGDLRRNLPANHSFSAAEIPREYLIRIYTELKRALPPSRRTSKSYAQFVDNIWTKACHHHPSTFAVGTLLVAYLLSGTILIGSFVFLVIMPWTTYSDAGREAYEQGHYAEAEKQWMAALKEAEKFGQQDRRLAHVATSLNNLAELYHKQGKYAEAEPLYKRALAVAEKALGPDHPEVATSLNNLAEFYRAQGKYAEAEPLRKRALAIREKALGPDHPEVATSLNNLAEFYRAQGKYAEAEPLYKRALAIYEKALGPDHPNVATALNNLAVLYNTQGKYAKAEPLYKRVLKIDEKALGPDHPSLATGLNNLAGFYKTQGKYAKAEPLYKRALKIDEKALGPDHPSLATGLNNLAGFYKTQAQYAKAEPLYKRALKIDEKALGPDHPSVAMSLNNLAGLYDTQGQYAQAEPLYKRALKIDEKVLGPDHPDVATSLNNLARLYDTQGQYAKAEPLYKRALKIHEKALGIRRKRKGETD